MNLEQQPSSETVESRGFVPISEFYARKQKPKPPQINKEEKVFFSVIERKTGRFTAAVYIGQKVLDELRWRVGDKVSLFIDKTLPQVQISFATEGQKHPTTLVPGNSERGRVARFTFALTKDMGIRMAKVRAHAVPHKVETSLGVGRRTAWDCSLVIEVPAPLEEPAEDGETYSASEEVEV